MNIVRSTDATRFENAASCIAYEYDTHTPDINIARIEINGRYPLEGRVMNTKVTELVYVEQGSGEVSVEGVSHPIQTGDVLCISKEERTSWEGTMALIIACAPAWTPEQHTSVL